LTPQNDQSRGQLHGNLEAPKKIRLRVKKEDKTYIYIYFYVDAYT